MDLFGSYSVPLVHMGENKPQAPANNPPIAAVNEASDAMRGRNRCRVPLQWQWPHAQKQETGGEMDKFSAALSIDPVRR